MKSFLNFISEGSRGYKRTLRRVNKAKAKYFSDDNTMSAREGVWTHAVARANMNDEEARLAITQKVRDPRIEARALKLAGHGAVRRREQNLNIYPERAKGLTSVNRLDDQSETLSMASSFAQDFTNNFADEFEDNPMSELLTKLKLSRLKSSQRFPKKNRDRRIIDPTRLGVRAFTAKP